MPPMVSNKATQWISAIILEKFPDKRGLQRIVSGPRLDPVTSHGSSICSALLYAEVARLLRRTASRVYINPIRMKQEENTCQ